MCTRADNVDQDLPYFLDPIPHLVSISRRRDLYLPTIFNEMQLFFIFFHFLLQVVNGLLCL